MLLPSEERALRVIGCLQLMESLFARMTSRRSRPKLPPVVNGGKALARTKRQRYTTLCSSCHTQPLTLHGHSLSTFYLPSRDVRNQENPPAAVMTNKEQRR